MTTGPMLITDSSIIWTNDRTWRDFTCHYCTEPNNFSDISLVALPGVLARKSSSSLVTLRSVILQWPCWVNHQERVIWLSRWAKRVGHTPCERSNDPLTGTQGTLVESRSTYQRWEVYLYWKSWVPSETYFEQDVLPKNRVWLYSLKDNPPV